MLDSDTKIQQAERTNTEMSWAFFSRPGDGNWNFIQGELEMVIPGISNKSERDIELGVKKSNGNSDFFQKAGFYLQGFSSSDSIKKISGELLTLNFDAAKTMLNSCMVGLEYSMMLDACEDTSKSDFYEEILKIKECIQHGQFDKIVAARRFTWGLPRFNTESLHCALTALRERYPQTLVFLVFTPQTGLWIGASPEQLITVKNGQANVMALAGTLTAEQSTWSKKEEEEQRVTHDFIGSVLEENQVKATETTLREVQLKKVRHLLREWKFPFQGINWHTLVSRLHPTPAVCGFPQRESEQWIQENEAFDRKLYAGWLGYVSSPAEELDLYVALRCGQLFPTSITCYAGCGVNLGSDPETEWKETEFKLGMLADVVVEFCG